MKGEDAMADGKNKSGIRLRKVNGNELPDMGGTPIANTVPIEMNYAITYSFGRSKVLLPW